MNFVQVFNFYLSLNGLLLLAFFALRSYSFILDRGQTKQSAVHELKLHYFALVTVLAILVAQPFFPKKDFLPSPIKVWSGISLKTFDDHHSHRDVQLVFSSKQSISATVPNQVSKIAFAFALLFALYRLLTLGLDVSALIRIQKNSYVVRSIKQVIIYSNDEIRIPFSFWFPFHSAVVLPSALLIQSAECQMVLAHELQHHRQKDTAWVYLLCALKIICAPNPVIHYWNRYLSELQEFACDETLIDRKKVKSRQYASYLLEVAKSALDQKYVPVCATGLAFLVKGNVLKRRIEKIMTNHQCNSRKTISITCAGVWFALMAGAAFASQGIIQDRRITVEDAKAMVSNVPTSGDFPVVVNDLVLNELNRYLGTPDGREFMKASYERLQTYRPLVERKLKDYGLPIELIAVPVVESGYQNLPESHHKGRGAGIWMFISETARVFNLQVNSAQDQRLDTKLETDAAMRYLKADHLVFQDWLLTVLAYNIGEKAVQKAIAQTGSRDAWELVKHGYQNDQNYLARVEAAILILNNPKSFQ